MATEPNAGSSHHNAAGSGPHSHNPSNLRQQDSCVSLNNRKRVVEKDGFVKTMMSLYTGNVEERKKLVFKL
jgi:hypothetical protein